MQDFDQARSVDDDRQFQLGGQTYTIRRKVRPEVLGMLDAVGDGELKQTIDELDALVRAVLVKRDAPRWDAARAVEDDEGESTISLDDLNAVLGWAIERLVKRPLGSADSSPSSQPTTAPTSPETSSSLVAVPSPT